MHFVDARAELSVIQDLGEKFANSEPDALKQQHFLPQSKGCRLLVYSTTEVQINHLPPAKPGNKNPLRTWSATLTACSKPNSVPDKKSVI